MTKDGQLTQIEADPADLIRLAEVCTPDCAVWRRAAAERQGAALVTICLAVA